MRGTLLKWAVAFILLAGTAVPLLAGPTAREAAPLPMGRSSPGKSAVDIGPMPSNDLLPPRAGPHGPLLSLDLCEALAYTHHPTLQAARESVVQAEAQIRVVDGTYLPTVSLEGDKIRGQTPDYDEEIALILNVEQTLWDSGQRKAQLAAARAEFRSSVQSFQSAWINQVQLVRAAYIQVLETEYLVAVAQDNVDRSKLNLEVAQRFYEGGLRSLIDVSTAQVQLSQARVSLAGSKANALAARVSLAQTIGVPYADIENRPLTDYLQMPTDLPDRDVAVRSLFVQHPALASLVSQAVSSHESANASRRSIGPQVSMKAYYGAYGYLHLAVPNWSVEVDFEFPFISPTAAPSADASDAQARQLLAQREADALKLLQQLDTSIVNAAGAKERSARAVEAVGEAVLNANLAYKRYKAGLSDIQELINARSYLASSRADYVQALSDMKTAEALFYQAMGELPRPKGLREDDPLLQVDFDEDEARDEAVPGFRPLPVPMSSTPTPEPPEASPSPSPSPAAEGRVPAPPPPSPEAVSPSRGAPEAADEPGADPPGDRADPDGAALVIPEPTREPTR